MKEFKQIDFWISVGLIISFTIITICEQDFAFRFNISGRNSFITGYYIVGFWQVLSMLVHVCNQKNYPLSFTRQIYSLITFICLITIPMGLFMLGVLLIIAAPMAIFYTCLCGYENFNRNVITNETI
jgi:hypothetical protein